MRVDYDLLGQRTIPDEVYHGIQTARALENFHISGVPLRQHCIDGITPNTDLCRKYVEHSIGVVSALNPLLGYETATELAAEALKTGKGIVELVREKKLLSEDQISTVLDPKEMTGTARH